MEKEERIKIEISENTVNFLLQHFDMLLVGLNTSKGKFQNEKEKDKIVKAIRNFVSYRIKEKIIDQKSDLWKVILDINNIDFSSLKEIEKIYMKLLKIKHYDSINNKNLHLSYPKSNYYKIKSKEENAKRGEGVLAKFFNIFK